MSERKKKAKRIAIRTGTIFVFLINTYGVVIFFFLFINTIYAKVLFAIYLYFLLCTLVSYLVVSHCDPGYVNQNHKGYRKMAT